MWEDMEALAAHQTARVAEIEATSLTRTMQLGCMTATRIKMPKKTAAERMRRANEAITLWRARSGGYEGQGGSDGPQSYEGQGSTRVRQGTKDKMSYASSGV
jgi:hypothetical protein